MRPPASPPDIDIGFLEPVLRSLAQAIGLELTLRLVRHCGGVPTYFPRELHDGHWLVELLGMDAARAANDTLGPGEHHVLPRGLVALRVARDRQMMRDRRRMSVRNLALKYGFSRRGVQRAFAERIACEQVDDGQDSLFPSA